MATNANQAIPIPRPWGHDARPLESRSGAADLDFAQNQRHRQVRGQHEVKAKGRLDRKGRQRLLKAQQDGQGFRIPQF